ncbi:MAG: beta strand repeat-containing protein [Actinomycetota bacterium]
MNSPNQHVVGAQPRSGYGRSRPRLRPRRPASTTATLAVLALLAGSLLGTLAPSAQATTPASWYASAGGADTAACTQPDPCSLAAALGKAVGGDTILLVTPASTSYVGNWLVTTTGTSPTTPLTVMAAPGVTNPTLDGNNGSAAGCSTASCNGPILSLGAGVSLSIEGLTLQNADNTTGSGVGGAIDTGDGVTGGTLTISNTTFTRNSAVEGGAIASGHNEGGGSVTIAGSTFSGNSASGVNSASGGGGAIDSGDNEGGGSVTIATSTFTDNRASSGGAIDSGHDNGGGSVTITASTFSANSAPDGGAIDSGDDFGGGSVTISTSTFSGNSADLGGAIDSGEFGGGRSGGGGSVTIGTSTFSGNSADTDGGAIDSGDFGGGGSVTIGTSTFSGNSAATDGGAIDSGDSGGGEIGGGGSVSLLASTLVNNTAHSGPTIDNSAGSGSVIAAGDLFAGSCTQGSGSWTDAGYNAAADASCLKGASTDVSSTAVNKLGALSSNGGPTKTILPLTGNPALGLIPNATTVRVGSATLRLCPTVDQRGVTSAPGAACAAGSVQLLLTTTTTLGSSANPSMFGQTISFTATVTAVATGVGTPGGQVHFFVDGSELTPAGSLDGSGVATSAPTSSLGVGTHTVTATYTGDPGFAASTSASLSQVVDQLTPTIGVTSTANPSMFGQPVSFSATLTGTQGTPTGTVQFSIDGVNFGTPVALSASGVATSMSTSSLAVANHAVTATYLGNTLYAQATASLTQMVNKASTTTTLGSSDAGSGLLGAPVVFTATVSVMSPGAGIPTGSVAFFENGSPIAGCGSVALSATTPDTASCPSTHGLPVGAATVTATYSGSTNDAASTSAPFTENTTATTSITGSHLGSITVNAGQTVFIGPGANVTGAITVNPGGFLDIEGATVHGAISTNGAAGVRMCASTLSGPITIAKSTGLVVIGDDEGSPPCAGNTISGAMSITANTAGVEFDHNTGTASVIITSNTGSVPPPDTGAVVAVANTISGSKIIQ